MGRKISRRPIKKRNRKTIKKRINIRSQTRKKGGVFKMPKLSSFFTSRSETPSSTSITPSNASKSLLIHLKEVCHNVGICLSLNYQYTEIMTLFNNFNDFTKLVIPRKYFSSEINVPIISSSGINGLIRLLHYREKIDNETYDAYCVMKISKETKSDNLGYEYLVGKYLTNKLCREFPIFVPTYGLYLDNRPSVTRLDDPATTSMDRSVFSSLIPLDYPTNINEICKRSKNLCLLGQYYSEFTELRTYIDNQRSKNYNEVPFIVFQLYYALYHTREIFTHYDLNLGNIGIIELPNNSYIRYKYELKNHLDNDITIEFSSKYIVKLIDYGRSFFSGTDENNNPINSGDLLRFLRESGLCVYSYADLYAKMTEIGFVFNPDKNVYPGRSHQSHDLRLLDILKIKYNPFYPELYPIFNSYVANTNFDYSDYRNKRFNIDVGFGIYNVRDACFKFADYLSTNGDNIINRNNVEYESSTLFGTLIVHGLNQEMTFEKAN